MKVAIVIGHTSKQKGALSKYFGLREWDFYIEVSKYIRGADILTHNPNISGYTTRIKDTARRLDEGNYDLVIECHFNSFFEPQANGCETLYFYRNDKTKELATRFSELVNDYTDIKIRGTGAKALANRHDRGFASVYYPKADAILIEPFFGSNKEDCEKIGSIQSLADIINCFISGL
jgi:N-acetylmuramoyl-L-alanine amidase